MFTPNEAQYRAVLSSMKMSQEDIDYISTRRDPVAATRIYWTGIAMYGLIYLAFTGGVAYVSYHHIFKGLMQERTHGTDALFYNAIWCIHIFPVIFLSLMLPAYIVYSILERFPNAAELVALKSIDDVVRRCTPRNFDGTMTSALSRPIQRKFLDETFKSLPIHEGLRYLNRKSIRWTKMGSIIAFLFIIPLMYMDATNYTIITPEGVREVPYGSSTLHSESWNDVSRIETGCFMFNGRNRNLSLKYDIFFKDGYDTNLFEASPLGNMAQRIQQVDDILAKLGKPVQLAKFTGGIYRGKPYLNKNCYTEIKKYYHEDYPKLIKLLRLDQYSPAS